MTNIVIPLPGPPRRIDAIDRKILRVLQEDASLSVAEIGERVGLSSTPCWKRIQRMEGEGIITGKVALVDQKKIGLGLSVFVSVANFTQFAKRIYFPIRPLDPRSNFLKPVLSAQSSGGPSQDRLLLWSSLVAANPSTEFPFDP